MISSFSVLEWVRTRIQDTNSDAQFAHRFANAQSGGSMYDKIRIAPSILSGDFMDMAHSIDQIEAAGAQWVHIDVMDGHFVPNLTMGVPFVAQARKITDLPLDVHLMITNPLVQIPWFIEAGADIITFHLEATTGDEAHRAIEMIHEANIKAAIAIKPKTDACALAPYINDIDMALVMSVEPGFSGQSFIEGSDLKVARIAEMATISNAHPLIQVDGGISIETAPLVCSKGADVLVCGNAFFKADDKPAMVKQIIKKASTSQTPQDA